MRECVTAQGIYDKDFSKDDLERSLSIRTGGPAALTIHQYQMQGKQLHRTRLDLAHMQVLMRLQLLHHLLPVLAFRRSKVMAYLYIQRT